MKPLVIEIRRASSGKIEVPSISQPLYLRGPDITAAVGCGRLVDYLCRSSLEAFDSRGARDAHRVPFCGQKVIVPIARLGDEGIGATGIPDRVRVGRSEAEQI